jgi:predicted transcriptional regulator of viral defense system
MKFEEFIKIAEGLPVIDTEILLTGVSDPNPVKVQISRWEKAGKLIQLKRGLYIFSKPYRKVEIYEPHIASLLKKPSYISLETAFEYHNLIPEAVTVYTSVTTKRPDRFVSEVGDFDYRHIKPALFWGYDPVSLHNQTAFIASPEKALLDFFYLRMVDVSTEYLDELRLQNLEDIDVDKLIEYAKRFKKPGMRRIAGLLKKYIDLKKKEGAG